jgi:hypothetical protein
VDKVALGQAFSEYFGFPCRFSFHRLLHIHQHLSSGTGTIGQLVADVPSGLSFTPPQETKKRKCLAWWRRSLCAVRLERQDAALRRTLNIDPFSLSTRHFSSPRTLNIVKLVPGDRFFGGGGLNTCRSDLKRDFAIYL